jgi:hypothetical protein
MDIHRRDAGKMSIAGLFLSKFIPSASQHPILLGGI